MSDLSTEQIAEYVKTVAIRPDAIGYVAVIKAEGMRAVDIEFIEFVPGQSEANQHELDR